MKRIQRLNLFLILASGIFVLTGAVAVISAWMTDLHKYDLKLSYSSYVALRLPTAIMYFIAAVLMALLLDGYVRQMQLRKAKRLVYTGVVFCILGTAMFPCNLEFSRITTMVHNCFAIGLMSAATVSFMISVVQGKGRRGQRISAFFSLLYAAAFIIALCGRFQPLYDTFFIWENLFIVLLMLGLYMEQSGKKKKEKGSE